LPFAGFLHTVLLPTHMAEEQFEVMNDNCQIK